MQRVGLIWFAMQGIIHGTGVLHKVRLQQYFSRRTSLCLGVTDERSRLAKQPVGLGLEGSSVTTDNFLSGGKNGGREGRSARGLPPPLFSS